MSSKVLFFTPILTQELELRYLWTQQDYVTNKTMKTFVVKMEIKYERLAVSTPLLFSAMVFRNVLSNFSALFLNIYTGQLRHKLSQNVGF